MFGLYSSESGLESEPSTAQQPGTSTGTGGAPQVWSPGFDQLGEWSGRNGSCVESRQVGCTSASSACLPWRMNRWTGGYDLVRRTGTRSGKTRFARDSFACEFWCVSLNSATRKSHLAMSAAESVFTGAVHARSTPKLSHSLRNRKRHHGSRFCRNERSWHAQLLWASTLAAEDGSSPDHWRVV